jgi:predicted Zn-ribbon and HTH transcriptional regulator
VRVVIERVTCDRCGQVFDFEKFNNSTKTVRMEGLSEWLVNLGWNLSDGVNHCDLCPNCKGRK